MSPVTTLPTDCLWTVEETARYLRVPRRPSISGATWAPARKQAQVGRWLRYRPEDVIAWFRQQQKQAA